MYWRSCEVSRRIGRMQASEASFGRSGLPNLNPMDSSEINCRMVDAEIVLGVILRFSFLTTDTSVQLSYTVYNLGHFAARYEPIVSVLYTHRSIVIRREMR